MQRHVSMQAKYAVMPATGYWLMQARSAVMPATSYWLMQAARKSYAMQITCLQGYSSNASKLHLCKAIHAAMLAL